MGTAIAIETEKIGRITWTEFNKQVKTHGTQADFARSIGVPPSTVYNWSEKLRHLRSQRPR